MQKCKQWRQQGFACIIAAENGPSFQGVFEKYHMTCLLLLFTETFFSRKVTQKLHADNRPKIGPLLLNSCVGQNHLARERQTQGSSKTMQLHHLKSKFSFFHSSTASFAQLHCSHSPIIERFVLLAAILDECQICLGGGGRFRRKLEKLINPEDGPFGTKKPRWPSVPTCPDDPTKKWWTVNSLISNQVF